MFCTQCGTNIPEEANFCSTCGAAAAGASLEKPGGPPAIASMPPVGLALPASDAILVRRIADYEKLSGIFWMILGGIQVLTVVGIIAGAWNLFAGYSRIKAAPLILARDPSVPDAFEDLVQLVIIGVINLFLGGVIGLIFVAFDFFIRDMVLSNRRLFEDVTGDSTNMSTTSPRPT